MPPFLYSIRMVQIKITVGKEKIMTHFEGKAQSKMDIAPKAPLAQSDWVGADSI